MRGRRLDAFAIALVALLARAAVVLWAYTRFPPVEDGHYYDVLARRIADGAGYTWLWPDGAVTFVAHYPVGYPALLGASYALFGAAPWVAMTTNAIAGAAGAYAMHRLVDAGDRMARWRPAAAALAVALHPAIVPYTAAIMTEGVALSLVVVGAALAGAARRADVKGVPGRTVWAFLVASGAAIGAATLVRPQCLVLAPVLGLFALAPSATVRARALAAAAVTAVTFACVVPWTVRNCERMHRCALVSVNGGWNLLIGATTSSGAWQPMPVPPECATVWDEAGKDVCFEAAARRTIAAAPLAWLARAPAKVAVTFDYFGAAPWYLHSSNPEAFGDRAKTALGALETLVCRLLLLGALATFATIEGARPGAARSRARTIVGGLGALAAFTVHGWIGYLAIPLLVALAGWRAVARAPLLVPLTGAIILATAATHAVFFGAGRYGLIVAPFVAAAGFLFDRPVAGWRRPVHIAAVDADRVVAGSRPHAGREREESPSSAEHDAG